MPERFPGSSAERPAPCCGDLFSSIWLVSGMPTEQSGAVFNIAGRRLERLAKRGETECVLRIVSGTHLGLSHQWKHVLVCVTARHLTARPFIWQTRFLRPSATPIEVDVTEVHGRRGPYGRELWSMTNAEIVEVHTPTSVLEWAIPPSEVEWVLARVA